MGKRRSVVGSPLTESLTGSLENGIVSTWRGFKKRRKRIHASVTRLRSTHARASILCKITGRVECSAAFDSIKQASHVD